MLVDDLLNSQPTHTLRLHQVKSECSQFISEAHGLAIHKALPKSYSDIHKVKVRFKKKADLVSAAFNHAFLHETHKISQRAVFAQSDLIEHTSPDLDIFYVFPINNYKFLYSKEVTNSSSDYKQVVDTIFESFDDVEYATGIITDLLKFSYSSQNLNEGITAGSEIIFYGIPYYYAVRASTFPDYTQIIK